MRLSKSHSSSSTLPYCSSAFADFILKPIKQIGKCIFSRFTSKLLTKKKNHFKAARNASKFSVDSEYPLKNKGSRIMESGACHVQFLLTIISVSCSGKHSSQFQSLNDLTRLYEDMVSSNFDCKTMRVSRGKALAAAPCRSVTTQELL